MDHLIVVDGDSTAYYNGYIDLVKDKPVLTTLISQRVRFSSLIDGILPAKADYRYLPDRWSVKEVIQHIVDSERVFAYRLLAFCRGEEQPLPGFDQEAWASTVDVTRRSLHDQRIEFESVRDASITLVQSMTPDEALRTGTMSGQRVRARALPFIIAGHLQHHIQILSERYGIGG